MQRFAPHIPSIAGGVYLLLICIFAFRPFQFIAVCDQQQIDWIPDERGVRISPCSALASPEPPMQLYEAFRHGAELTLDLFLKTAAETATGARWIVSYSQDVLNRNFTLGQEEDALVFRLRTKITDPNGVLPHLTVPKVFSSGVRQHIAVTYDGKKERIYVDGKLVETASFLRGNLSNWSRNHYLVFGNEMTANRPWEGILYRVALYNRALTAGEIVHNFEKSNRRTDFPPVTRGLVGCFDFREGRGDAAYDHSPKPAVGKLVKARFQSFGETLMYHFHRRFFPHDMAFNVMGFVPLAFVIYFNFPALRRLKGWGRYGIPISIGFMISLTIEYLQRFTMIRNANLWDIIYNVAGTALGVLLLHATIRFREVSAGQSGGSAEND